MQDHTWVQEVLSDIKEYAETNDLPVDLVGAITLAAEKAKGKLPIVYTDFVPSQSAGLQK